MRKKDFELIALVFLVQLCLPGEQARQGRRQRRLGIRRWLRWMRI